MSRGIFDWKVTALVGLALVAGLLGARSMLSGADEAEDRGFGGDEPLSFSPTEPGSEAVEWIPPADPRNPFQVSGGFSVSTQGIDADLIDPELIDPELLEAEDSTETIEPSDDADESTETLTADGS